MSMVSKMTKGHKKKYSITKAKTFFKAFQIPRLKGNCMKIIILVLYLHDYRKQNLDLKTNLCRRIC